MDAFLFGVQVGYLPYIPIRLPSALLGDNLWPYLERIGQLAPVPVLLLSNSHYIITPEYSRRLYQAVNSPCKLIYSFETRIYGYNCDCTSIADALNEQGYLDTMAAYMHALNNKTT